MGGIVHYGVLRSLRSTICARTDARTEILGVNAPSEPVRRQGQLSQRILGNQGVIVPRSSG